ncbi:MAG: ABC transporter ATP-binding protein [Candidatus Hydrogenedentes bacterium]|nr:ABC transporter ATP-binding protein [Candidatus Hydrogenedentota bacterium]
MSDSECVIEFREATYAYDGVPAVENVSLEVNRKDFLALIGPNGGGKTTLLKLALGLLKPSSGVVRVLGQSPHRTRQRLGYVPQFKQFDDDFPATVEEVVLTGRLGHAGLGRRYRDEDRAAASRALNQVAMGALAKRSLAALSGGERQRALVARALVTDPDVLLLDEPTASVDSRVEHRFYDLLGALHERIPIVLVSHDLGFISSYVTRVACINRRLTVNPVSDLHARDLEAMYNAPVRLWSHDCEL